ncbi:MAG: hypothetical protein M3Z85_06845, partial [Acidobacteriota bacterium]|nr:hypothetical protein [Acidobacteriota bacterium]
MTGPEGYWDRKDLERRLCLTLDFARRALERLAETGYSGPMRPDDSVPPEKLISETAFLLVAASAPHHCDEVKKRIRDVAEILIPHARGERMLMGVCLRPSLALDYAMPHLCLERLGYPDPGFDAVLRQSGESQARAGHERVPHRMMEQEWILGNRRSRLARHSVLNRPMDLLNGSRDDVYGFTHALMYATDLNLRPRRLRRGRTAILAEADVALARCLDEEDYDLGGEVLLAWPLTGRSWSAAAAFGFRVLASDSLPAASYHQIYVMGLLYAATLQRGSLPPRKIAPSAVARGGASTMLEFVDTPCSRRWRDEFDRLEASERDALAGFLFHVALRRKIRQRSYGEVNELLHAAHSFGLTNTPAASQAVELLQ